MWTPPENPNPSAILHSAVDDARDGRHEQSLAKFLWFHNHAVQYQPGQSGVRRSFALSYWLNLATVYPPARDAFIRTRDETDQAFRKDISNFALFQDIAAMNKRLGDELRTIELFASVAETDPPSAQAIYQVAEPDLIAAGQFHVCALFLEPKGRLERAAECYRVTNQYEATRPVQRFPVPKLARPFYIRNVATLVALLALNQRIDDARTAYNDALAIVNDDEFRTIMDAALSGHLPDPEFARR